MEGFQWVRPVDNAAQRNPLLPRTVFNREKPFFPSQISPNCSQTKQLCLTSKVSLLKRCRSPVTRGKVLPWQTRHSASRFLRELALPFSHFHQAHGNQNFSLWQSRNDTAWATGALAPAIPAHGTHLAAQLNQPADEDSSETSADFCCFAAHPPS